MLPSMPDGNAGDRVDVGGDIVDAFRRLLRQLAPEAEGLDRESLGWRPAPATTGISNLLLDVIGAMTGAWKGGWGGRAGGARTGAGAAGSEAPPLDSAELMARISAAERDLEVFRYRLSIADLLAMRHRPARNLRASGLVVLLIAWGHATEHLAQVRLTRQLYADRRGLR